MREFTVGQESVISIMHQYAGFVSRNPLVLTSIHDVEDRIEAMKTASGD
jgi:hypothetical protein